jgi:hypothetical protein
MQNSIAEDTIMLWGATEKDAIGWKHPERYRLDYHF